jgi:hypothetical protein
MLRVRKKKLTAQMSALEKELKHLGELEAAAMTPADGNSSEPKRKAKPLKRGDFRNKIREIMEHTNRPMRPSEVTQVLKDSGISNAGTGDFNSRVSTELFKLTKAGELKKTNDGYISAKAA